MSYEEGTLGYLADILKAKKLLFYGRISLTNYELIWQTYQYKDIEVLCKEAWKRYESREYPVTADAAFYAKISNLRKIVKLGLEHKLIEDFGWKPVRRQRNDKGKSHNFVSDKVANKPLINSPANSNWANEVLTMTNRIEKSKSELTSLLNQGVILSKKVFSMDGPKQERRLAVALRDLCEMSMTDASLRLT